MSLSTQKHPKKYVRGLPANEGQPPFLLIAEPVISKLHTIENRDAVLACDRVEFKRDG